TAPGTFVTGAVTEPTANGNTASVSLGDLDGDGLVDVVMWIDGYSTMQVALQTSPRVFTAAGQYDLPTDFLPLYYDDTAAIAAVNGDGKADVLVVTPGLVVFYNSTGSYPVLDASVTSTAQAEDSGPVAHIEWQHQVSNAGPTALVDGFLLQDLPLQY